MLILGISTSSKKPSVAVMKDGVIISFICDESGRSHSATLMALLEEALDKAFAQTKDLDAIAVDIGPGSFTGVRIGVSCANALASALSIPVIPVCSLDAMRRSVPEEGTVCTLIDCRNGNCYAAVYKDGATVCEPCPAETEEILSSLSDDARVIGDCFDEKTYPDARLVLIEASMSRQTPVSEASPMYLRPSQAERMKTL